MSKSMRILTYNTQMRSALMEMGFPPSIPPEYTAPQRAKLISKAILTNPEEIDVVCLNEIFDEPAREVLSQELRAEFPYQVAKADTFYTRIVKPGFTGDLADKIWELTFGPVADLAALAKLKLEDSGLFLASRFPFATIPASGDVADLLDPVAFATGVPVVRFLMYEAASDNDKFAAKGVLYVRLKPPGETDRHVFISHTQADTERVGENVGDRHKQIQNVADFIEQSIGEAPPFSKEVFFLGDLNIVGHGDQNEDAHPADPAEPDPEWTELFGKPAAPMFGQLVDRWGRDQCPGGLSGRTDPGFTADVVYPPYRQRLDYVFTSASSQLAVQHLRIDRELADPHGAMKYLSDHHPLRADFHQITPNCTPATAFPVPDVVDFSRSASLFDGSVKWFRFDIPGTYDVALQHHGADTIYEIYLGDDFSTPQPAYRNITDPERGTRFVLAAPFFVKIHLVERRSECSFTLRTHRHEGRTWRDAIVLVPEQFRHEHYPAQPFNIDTADADWDDSESKWFLAETPRVRLAHPVDLSVGLFNPVEEAGGGPSPVPVRLSVGKWDGVAPPASLISDSGPSSDPQNISWPAGDNEHFFVLVQRTSSTSRVVSFDIVLSTPISLFIARPPALSTTLTCQVETSGWGADDIALELRADGELIADIPNSVIGDFEDDSVGDVGDKIPAEITPYIDGVEVKVIEEDDIDDNDVGVGTIPPVAEIRDDDEGSPFKVLLPRGLDGSVAGTLVIGVDDGRYGFTCRVSKWHPSA
jgi:Endonuclease/Exonuclease/phosphatase family